MYEAKPQLAEALHETLAGYARANSVIEDERMERLPQMTPEQARAIFDQLVEGWESASGSSRTGLERLDLWRAETLVAVRRAFERLAKAEGLM
jgi:hypothetical protein